MAQCSVEVPNGKMPYMLPNKCLAVVQAHRTTKHFVIFLEIKVSQQLTCKGIFGCVWEGTQILTGKVISSCI